ncbi:MAG: hypothetical protein RMI79_05205 [Nitrososphaerota archaeon]|nr:hypothetical protein [Nitrososphaerota archaeon]
MHSREATLIIFSMLLLIVILIKVPTAEASPTIFFIRAYNVSFENNLGFFASSGPFGFTANGFKNSCVNLSSPVTLNANLDVKGSFKMSFMFKIDSNIVLNFTRLRLSLDGSTNYVEVVLGRKKNGRIAIFKDRSVSESINLDPDKWYNITIEMDVSRDFLIVSGNGSLPTSISTGVNTQYLKTVLLQIGIINPNGTVKAYVDEFSMLVSPIVFTDKPIYASSNSVTIRISGDQFPSSNMDIAILRPDGATVEKRTITNVNNSRIIGLYGFSYSTSLNNPVPGTYTVRVNSSGFRVEYHFGVWNTPRIWERKSIVNIKAGGFAPNSFVTLSVRNSTHEVLSRRLNVDQYGRINHNITVPVDLQLNFLRALLVYDGTYDFLKTSGITDVIEITVTRAIINVTLITDANMYERVSPINIRAYTKYKDGSIIPWNSAVKLSLIYNDAVKQSTYMDYVYDSYWSKTIRLKPSDERGNYLIKVEASDPYGNFGTGNKTIVVTAAKLIITLINQPEESYQRSTKLNISVSVKYRDETLVEYGDVTLEMAMGNRKVGPINFIKTGLGQWSISYKIPIAEQTGKWDLKINAVDNSENSGDLSLSIFIIPAELIVQTTGPINKEFSRTQSISLGVTVKYPSYEPLREENGIVNVSLIHSERGVVLSKLLRFSAGSWRGNITVPRDAPLGKYVLRVSAKDPYGNYGHSDNAIQVSKAILNVGIKDLGNVYQIGFDTVRLKCVVKYLDGSIMDMGNVTAIISSSTTSSNITLKYVNGEWIGEYGLPLTAPTGDYTVIIRAEDPYGNTGTCEGVFRVSNIYVILIVVSIAIALSVSVSRLIIRRRRSRTIPSPMAEDYDLYG